MKPTPFRLTELLLLFWERLDGDVWIEQDTITLVRCVAAREESKGIPGVLA